MANTVSAGQDYVFGGSSPAASSRSITFGTATDLQQTRLDPRRPDQQPDSLDRHGSTSLTPATRTWA